MAMWRCPHCGTPQAESARCWVCRRSSTACGTCRHFRRSVAAQLGYCGLDRQRLPLHGDEIRPCWEARPGVLVDLTPPPAEPVHRLRPPAAVMADERTAVRRLEFVPVDEPPPPAPEPAVARPRRATKRSAPPATTPAPEPRWSLWAELET